MTFILSLGIPIVIVAIVVFIWVSTSARERREGEVAPEKESWDMAIVDLCRQMGFKRDSTSSGFTVTKGKLGAYDVSLSLDENLYGEAPSHLFAVKIPVDVGGDFLLKRKGSSAGWASAAGQPTPSGDPSLDGVVEVFGAPPALGEALQQQAELRAVAKRVVGEWGAYVSRGELVLKTPDVPASADGIMGFLEPMVELARWVSQPEGSRFSPAIGSETASALRRYSRGTDEQKLTLLQRFLEHLAPLLGPGQVFVDTNDQVVEWRGQVGDFPGRIKIDSFPYSVVEAKVTSPHGSVLLEHDPEKVPQVGAPPAWDESDTQRVFLGRGVFVEGPAAQIDLTMRRLGALPPELGGTIAEAMARNGVSYFRIEDQRVSASFGTRLTELADPEGQLVHMTQIVGWVATVLQATPAAPSLEGAASTPTTAAPGTAPTRATCEYCHTLFLLGANGACPNCGAPVTG